MQFLLALCAFAAVAFSEYVEEDDVVILTADNFESVISGNDFVLVEFYAPWCGHCKSLEPHYKKAATALKATGAVLGALDATAHGSVASGFGVKGYPTLKWFSHGKPTDYTGGRTEDTIVSWINKKVGPASTQLTSDAQIEEFIAAHKVAAIGVFPEGSDALKTFQKVASTIEGASFAHTSDVAFGTKHGLANGDGVVLFKPFDEKIVTIETFTESELSEFVEGNSFPYVIPFSMDAVPRIFQSPIGASALVFTHTEIEGLSDVAKEFKGKIVFSTADDKEQRLLDYVGVKGSDFPKVVVINTANGGNVKYKLEGEVTKETIQAFVAKYFAGSLTPTLKSEDVPAENNGPVKVVVSKAFNEVVDGTKHVFLEVYAPWCGHCKKLDPIWTQLGEAYASNDNVVIAKMDGTLNEVLGVNIKGFPTIFYFAPGHVAGAPGFVYEGGREFEPLKSFIASKVGGAADSEESKDEL